MSKEFKLTASDDVSKLALCSEMKSCHRSAQYVADTADVRRESVLSIVPVSASCM